MVYLYNIHSRRDEANHYQRVTRIISVYCNDELFRERRYWNKYLKGEVRLEVLKRAFFVLVVF